MIVAPFLMLLLVGCKERWYNLEANSFDFTNIWQSTILFSFLFVLFLLIILLSRKSYDYYVEDGKLTIKSNRGKALEFDLKSAYTVYLSKTINYRGIQIVQKAPTKKKVSFLIEKNFDFLDWLTREVESYKKMNPDAEVSIVYKSFEKMYLFNIWFFLIISLNTLNMSYIDNIFLSAVCLIGEIIFLIK
jgi:hypothetical protein